MEVISLLLTALLYPMLNLAAGQQMIDALMNDPAAIAQWSQMMMHDFALMQAAMQGANLMGGSSLAAAAAVTIPPYWGGVHLVWGPPLAAATSAMR